MRRNNLDKTIVLKRIKILFKQAERAFKSHPERSHRYVKIARDIAMKARMTVPKALKRKYCKHCYKYLRPGVNSRVRVRKGLLVYYCFSCRKYTKIPYGKRRLKKPKTKKISS